MKDRKVVAVFAACAREAALAVDHVQRGVGGLPIHLYCREEPLPDTAAACAFVATNRSVWRAVRELWPYWVALTATTWTGPRAPWGIKLAPFLIPPFRFVVLNENGDFFPGTPRAVLTHVSRRMWARVREWFYALVSAGYRIGAILRGLALFPFAWVAQWHSPLSRFAFRRLHGRETLDFTLGPAYPHGITRIEYRGREWRTEETAKILSATETRWVLFEREDTRASVDDMLPLFNDPRTFAVGRQTGYRAWRRLLFATAPFRVLQPDECTRVFAPVSTQILADRAKLLALGVPKLSSFGSNWYLLFWQAAAAGWHSYGIGSADAVGQLPAVPFDEAEFVHTLLMKPGLARLAPQDLPLTRGNVARCKIGGPGFRGLPRVLILSPYLPFPLSHGGAVRMYNLCRALNSRVDFVLLCFREKGDFVDYAKLHEVFREVYVVDIDEKHADPNLPTAVSGYESGSMRAMIAEICREKQIELVQVEYTQMAAYREAAPDLPAILVEHDLTFTLHRQLRERGAPHEYEHWLRFEKERLRAYDAVWTMSEHDRDQAIAAGSSAKSTFAVPNGVDLHRFSPAPESVGVMEILYVGSFRHGPNFLGFQELRDSVMPAVWSRFPEACLRVVAGPDHEQHWPGTHLLEPRITVHGFIADLLPLYRTATLAVVPLPVSAGTNIKLMEALACQRAVVTTPVGCAGLELRDGHDALIRELGPAFAAGICELLANADERSTIAQQGRKTAEQRFSWESIAERAWTSYETIWARVPRA